MFKFILALFLISSPAFADEWSREDTYREAAYLTLHTLDWAQTREIARNPAYYEQNMYLGKHPTVRQVDRYFAAMALAHVGVAYLLPSEWRRPFQYLTIGVELGAVAHNFSIGISANF
jgi:hypothetical protein